MTLFLRGALAMACAIAALFFLRFWRDTRDRMFAIFGGAFVVFSVSWVLLAVNGLGDEQNVPVFALRAVAFGLIALGVIDKNRR